VPRTLGRLTVALTATAASIFFAPAAVALPDCGTIAPQTMQCERGGHVGINTSPNVIVNNGPLVEQPWFYPYPVRGINGWPVV
jgi:hypothetical protein